MSKDTILNEITDDNWKEQGLMPEQDGADNPISDPEIIKQLEKDFA